MDGFPPNSDPEGPSQEADPLALARRLIDMARAEELEDVELGPLPVLPEPGAELSPLELAMQLLYAAREEEDASRSPEDNPLDLAMRLIDSVRLDAGGQGEDRLAVASQLLGVEERERELAARRSVESQASAELEIPVLPLLIPLQPEMPTVEPDLPELPALQSQPDAANETDDLSVVSKIRILPLIDPMNEIPALPLVEAATLPELPALPWVETAAIVPELPSPPLAQAAIVPELPSLPLVETATAPEFPALPLVEAATVPELPALPLVEAATLPELPALPLVESATVPEPPALPLVEAATVTEPPLPLVESTLAEHQTLVEAGATRVEQESGPADENRPRRLADMPALPIESARSAAADPAELARQLLRSGERTDPAYLARQLLDEAAREEKSDPFSLARRLLKDALREEKPAATSLMGAPVEEGAPPPRFDPAGLGGTGEELLGAPEQAPFTVTEAEAWQDSTTRVAPLVFEERPVQPPRAAQATSEPPLQPPRAQEPAASEPPIQPPWAAQGPAVSEPAQAPRDEPESAPRLVLERAESSPAAPAKQADPDSKPLRLERREMPLGRTMRIELPRTGANHREEASRLALERAPRAKVESTRDGEHDPVRARPETSIPTVPVVAQTYKPVAAAAAPLGASRRAAALAPRRPDGFGTDLKKRLRRLVDRSARVEPEDVVIFTRQFSAMVNAGLQLHQALHFYAESHTESGLGEVVSEVAGKVSQGSTLSAAMRQHPSVFPEVYTGLIAAGETTGMLVAILSKLAELCERNQKLRQRVLAAVTYPAVVMVVSLVCIAVFIWVVLPMFVPMFNQLGVQLPWPTRMLIWLSEAGRNPVLLTTLGLTIPLLWLSWPFWRRFFGNPRRKRAIDRALLGLPYFGLLIERIITARLLFSMASLLDAGIPFTNCLEKCEHVAGNAEIAHRLKMARDLLIEGDTAADCLAAHRVFPRGAIQMIAVGEESAQLSEMIRRVATVYEEDVQMALMDLASMLEPLILLVMGVVVGFIVLASALPTAQLLQSL